MSIGLPELDRELEVVKNKFIDSALENVRSSVARYVTDLEKFHKLGLAYEARVAEVNLRESKELLRKLES